MQSELSLTHLARALATYANYSAIDVFADDLRELRELSITGNLPAGIVPLDATGERFLATVEGRSYILGVDRQAGVARLARLPTPAPAPVPGALVGAAIGGATAAAIGAAMTKKGEGWVPGLVLGLLAGAAIGQAATAQQAPRRVFTLRFNPSTEAWEVYDGGLVGWMKHELGGAT
jgi:hypothetical protein